MKNKIIEWPFKFSIEDIENWELVLEDNPEKKTKQKEKVKKIIKYPTRKN